MTKGQKWAVAMWVGALLWVGLYYGVTAGSRQICEAATSPETCQWEMR